ncbi:hypothetical protein DFS34DRAFT_307944 [Phlyctochytrium arcticum]|nr:hypothetical protein DFS34DRAFT_307944 [Phlyctochytrium arcticum]
MAARHHSPVLLQITSTNALESYHRLVKARGKCTKRCSLLRAARALVKVNKQRWLEADRTATVFRTKTLKRLNAYPEIGKFPYPIQRLLIDQYMAVEKRIAKGKPIPQLEGDCHCLFARQYQLPFTPLCSKSVGTRFTKEGRQCLYRSYCPRLMLPVTLERERLKPQVRRL